MVDANNDGKDDETGLDIRVVPPNASVEGSDEPDDGVSLESRVEAIENALRGANLEGIGGQPFLEG